MILDITTRVDASLVEPWLEKQENRHIAMGHVGTHLDTYLKSHIPMDYFKRNGVLIDASDYAEKREICLEDVKDIKISEGDFVIFRTDRIKKIYGTVEYFKEHPQLSDELIEYLCQKKLSFIGIDTAGIRRGDEHTPADELCEKNNIYVIENLCDLDKIQDGSFTVYTMWLEDEKATGLKCRVIVEQE